MERNLFRSNYTAGKPAWVEWILLGIMLTITLSSFIEGGITITTVVSAVAAIGFGTFVFVAELRALRPQNSE